MLLRRLATSFVQQSRKGSSATSATDVAAKYYDFEAEKGMKLWKKLTFLVAIPGVVLCWVNAFIVNPEEHARPEFKPYPHLRRRTKAFPWGDGDHTLLHNKYTNAITSGYETESVHGDHGDHH